MVSLILFAGWGWILVQLFTYFGDIDFIDFRSVFLTLNVEGQIRCIVFQHIFFLIAVKPFLQMALRR